MNNEGFFDVCMEVADVLKDGVEFEVMTLEYLWELFEDSYQWTFLDLLEYS